MDKRVFGQIGENTAADVLRAKGYRILKQNYRCRYGDVTTQILIQTNSRGHPLNVLVPRRLEDKCSRYSFKKVSYPIDRSRSDK
ncbi:MAG: YraN family protein [Firmicutes bacterium]|nr:YraN family protein [Bacillota bacterium]